MSAFTVVSSARKISRKLNVEQECVAELAVCNDDDTCLACRESWESLDPIEAGQLVECSATNIRALYETQLTPECSDDASVSSFLDCVSNVVDARTCQVTTCISYFNECAADDVCQACLSFLSSPNAVNKYVESCEDMPILAGLIEMPQTCDLTIEPLNSVLECLAGNVGLSCGGDFGSTFPIYGQDLKTAPNSSFELGVTVLMSAISLATYLGNLA
eukprot:CAMPEP_0171453704 /NCGR_PEP_ID=MMETSP0945-20130129/1299_1 /TAXON_ID=109269 /ORGANISM="Vaucheria litorea, Strain CCMP2940" /LENGTH=216 /DNA_ID=CAMNT_0011978611 /DNA_START=202 /DNA_END=852 /DNA_ORIENTATION=-